MISDFLLPIHYSLHSSLCAQLPSDGSWPSDGLQKSSLWRHYMKNTPTILLLTTHYSLLTFSSFAGARLLTRAPARYSHTSPPCTQLPSDSFWPSDGLQKTSLWRHYMKNTPTILLLTTHYSLLTFSSFAGARLRTCAPARYSHSSPPCTQLLSDDVESSDEFLWFIIILPVESVSCLVIISHPNHLFYLYTSILKTFISCFFSSRNFNIYNPGN